MHSNTNSIIASFSILYSVHVFGILYQKQEGMCYDVTKPVVHVAMCEVL